MKVTEIHASRKFNLGNYEMLEVGATADLDFNEGFDEAFRKLDALLLSKKPLQGKNGYQGGRQ